MLDFLKGAKVNIQVDLERPDYFPGETVQATISVQAEKDTQIEEGRVVLLRREEYQEEEESTDSDGDRTTSKVWRTDEDEIARHVFLTASTLAAGVQQSFKFTAPVPADALPTWQGGKTIKAKWLVKASLGRKLALDWNGEEEIAVVVAPPGTSNHPAEFGTSNKPSEVELAFALPNREWVIGETIEGELLVKPKKDFEINEINVKLGHVETVKGEGNTKIEDQSVKPIGKTKMQSGQSLRYPFKLTIPTPRPSTGTTPHGSVSWKLTASLARGFLKGSYDVETEIFVFTKRAR